MCNAKKRSCNQLGFVLELLVTQYCWRLDPTKGSAGGALKALLQVKLQDQSDLKSQVVCAFLLHSPCLVDLHSQVLDSHMSIKQENT